MIPRIRLPPGGRLLVSAEFLWPGPLFFGLRGPVAVTFSSLWMNVPKEIENPGPHLWQLFPHASRRGPMGAEVPVSTVGDYESRVVFAAGDPADPYALLVVDILSTH